LIFQKFNFGFIDVQLIRYRTIRYYYILRKNRSNWLHSLYPSPYTILGNK